MGIGRALMGALGGGLSAVGDNMLEMQKQKLIQQSGLEKIAEQEKYRKQDRAQKLQDALLLESVKPYFRGLPRGRMMPELPEDFGDDLAGDDPLTLILKQAMAIRPKVSMQGSALGSGAKRSPPSGGGNPFRTVGALPLRTPGIVPEAKSGYSF